MASVSTEPWPPLKPQLLGSGSLPVLLPCPSLGSRVLAAGAPAALEAWLLGLPQVRARAGQWVRLDLPTCPGKSEPRDRRLGKRFLWAKLLLRNKDKKKNKQNPRPSTAWGALESWQPAVTPPTCTAGRALCREPLFLTICCCALAPRAWGSAQPHECLVGQTDTGANLWRPR